MILGIGSDLANIDRIDAMLKKYGARFIARVFTDAEQEQAAQRQSPAPTYAKRFAAKEACAKALGTGIANGITLRDIGVVTENSGRPALALTGEAHRRLWAMTPKGMTPRIHLTLTDDVPWAQAFVVIEAI